MGKRSDFERRERDCYDTPPEAVWPLLPHLPGGARIAEPCAGAGQLCDVLFGKGWFVPLAWDIAPRRAGVVQYDAMSLTEDILARHRVELIVTNPPWPAPRSGGEPTLGLIEHLRQLRPTWLLLSADFMHNVYAKTLMAEHCSAIVSVGRVRWIEGSKHDGKDNACWYRFEPDGIAATATFYPR